MTIGHEDPLFFLALVPRTRTDAERRSAYISKWAGNSFAARPMGSFGFDDDSNSFHPESDALPGALASIRQSQESPIGRIHRCERLARSSILTIHSWTAAALDYAHIELPPMSA